MEVKSALGPRTVWERPVCSERVFKDTCPWSSRCRVWITYYSTFSQTGGVLVFNLIWVPVNTKWQWRLQRAEVLRLTFRGLRNRVLRRLSRACLAQLMDRILMAAPRALDILVFATSTPAALAVISFNKTTDGKFNAVGGKKKKKLMQHK